MGDETNFLFVREWLKQFDDFANDRANSTILALTPTSPASARASSKRPFTRRSTARTVRRAGTALLVLFRLRGF